MAELPFPAEALPWLARADSDLRTAQAALALDPPETETAGFHCQQAVEKCLKAVLVAHDLDPPRVHDLEVLLEMCADQGHDLTDFRSAILDLNPFAVQFRYPGEEAPPEVEEVQAGLETAESVRQRVQSLLPSPA
jgi:HEPN domain-containing protein